MDFRGRAQATLLSPDPLLEPESGVDPVDEPLPDELDEDSEADLESPPAELLVLDALALFAPERLSVL